MAVHEDLPDLDIRDFRLWWERGPPSEATHGRLRVWKVIATTLMFVALTSIAFLALRASDPRPMKGPPDVSPVGVPAAGGSHGNETKTALDAVTPLGKEGFQSARIVKDPSAEPKTQASLGLPTEVSGVPPASQSADTKPNRITTMPPDGVPIAKPASIEPSPLADGPNQPATSGPAAMKDAPRLDQQSVEPDPATKYSPASAPFQVAIAEKEGTARTMGAESRKRFPPEPPVKPDGATTVPKSSLAPTTSMPAPGAPGEAIRQSFDRMLHTIGGLIGQSNPPVPQSDSMSASARWAVQLAAPRSETEAKSDVKRLGARYASTLKGSKISVHEAVVDGVTVHRLRVVGLSKAGASALCASLKDGGGSCFVAR
jgi:SPOR domain